MIELVIIDTQTDLPIEALIDLYTDSYVLSSTNIVNKLSVELIIEFLTDLSILLLTDLPNIIFVFIILSPILLNH